MYRALLDPLTKIRVDGHAFSLLTVLGLTRTEVAALQCVAEQGVLLYALDIRVLVRLLRITSPDVEVQVTDELRACFEQGSHVTLGPDVRTEVGQSWTVLSNWIINTQARGALAYAANYIHSCYYRERNIPLIPLEMTHMYETRGITGHNQGVQYYLDVWCNRDISEQVKRNIFLMSCRGRALRYVSKDNISFIQKSLPKTLVMNMNVTEWSRLAACNDLFDLFIEYEKLLQSRYVVVLSGGPHRKKTRYENPLMDSEGNISLAGFYYGPADLFNRFVDWVSYMHPQKNIISLSSSAVKADVLVKTFYSSVLFSIAAKNLGVDDADTTTSLTITSRVPTIAH
jgi:hypothetical protein